MTTRNFTPIFYRRNLPHLQLPGTTLFLTFRLVGSLPQPIIQTLQQEAEQIDKTLEAISDTQSRSELAYREHRRLFGKWDEALAQSTYGPTWLKEPAIAQIVTESMHYLDKKRYDLLAYCIMPNHNHLVFTPLLDESGSYYSLSSIMQSLKGFTAYKANQLLNRKGAFWQDESYDHAVRDQAELERIIKYVVLNPVKAGLVQDWHEWPGTYCKTPF